MKELTDTKKQCGDCESWGMMGGGEVCRVGGGERGAEA